MRTLLLCLALTALAPRGALAQFVETPTVTPDAAAQESKQRIKVGVVIKATGGSVFRIVATAPVPTDWPEQQVRIVDEEITSTVKDVDYREITGGGGLKQLVVDIPQLPAGAEARALITYEVTRRALPAPVDTIAYRIPKKPDKQAALNLGASPFIESRHPKIVAAAKAAVEGQETDWAKVEAIFNWVRKNIAYKTGPLKGAARALLDKEGDTDELTSLFIAMCRAQKIPARTVFVLGHCYAEFYLEDAQGQGRWFPCQVAGAPSFGTINDIAPILQKGDNFKNPENPKERQRFVTEYFNASGKGGKPKVQFVSELVAQ